MEVPIDRLITDAKLINDHKVSKYVLLLHGSFCPVHINHLNMVKCAQRFIEEDMLGHVIGIYITPSHDTSLERKLGSGDITAEHRCRMIQLAIESEQQQGHLQQAMMNPHLCSLKENSGIVVEHKQLKTRVLQALSKDPVDSVDVCFVSVCGTDSLPRMRKSFGSGVICVINREPDYDVDAFVSANASKAVASGKPFEVHVVRDVDAHGNYSSMSSTEVRRCLQGDLPLNAYLHGSVIRYIQEQKLRFQFQAPVDSGDSKRKKPSKNQETQSKYNNQKLTQMTQSLVSGPLFDWHTLIHSDEDHVLGKGRQGMVVSKRLSLTPSFCCGSDVTSTVSSRDVDVVVKCFSIKTAKKAKSLHSFIREANLSEKVLKKGEQRTGLLEYFGCGVVPRPCVGTNCLEGGDYGFLVLQQAVPIVNDHFQSPLDACVGQAPEEICSRIRMIVHLKWLAESCEGMESLWHEHQLIHRDISSDNLLLCHRSLSPLSQKVVAYLQSKGAGSTLIDVAKYSCVVSDFGVSMLMVEEMERREREARGERGGGPLRGSLRHYAPEAIGQGPRDYMYDDRSDIFLFGTAIYQLIAGCLFFDGEATPDVIARTGAGDLPPFGENFSERVIAILKKCFAFDRMDRWTWGSLKIELLSVIEELISDE